MLRAKKKKRYIIALKNQLAFLNKNLVSHFECPINNFPCNFFFLFLLDKLSKFINKKN